MSDAADMLIEHCREAGQRITGPRRIIANVVAKADDHPDVTEIYRRVAAIDPGISLSPDPPPSLAPAPPAVADPPGVCAAEPPSPPEMPALRSPLPPPPPAMPPLPKE
ncbi:transcriptional repressor [Bosea sp. 125]|uniref:transcriptional repressor n=1 Tax=Bosea sp. 125 TaxID=2653179 RepID=UPI00191557EE|nr:transcriptional repressor [Bosea sp. 125]